MHRPANRLVAGELEARWNKALACVVEVESKIAAHDAARPRLAPDPALLATLATTQDHLGCSNDGCATEERIVPP